jgi:subtilisin-like proprotein convertase family protein
MTCVNLAATVTGTVGSVKVTAAVNHSSIGDLVVKLKSPTGTVVTLMSRPGVSETADDGADKYGNNYGDSSMLHAGFPITFQTGASTSAENMGSGLAAYGLVCSDGVCTFAPNNGAAAAGNLTTFNGQTAAGTWQFCAGDSTPQFPGFIDKVTLTITN